MNIIKLIELRLKHKDIREKYLNNIPTDISVVVFDNTYTNSMSMELEGILELFVHPALLEELDWFLYDYVPGTDITLSTGQVYTINTTEDFIKYLSDNYELN